RRYFRRSHLHRRGRAILGQRPRGVAREEARCDGTSEVAGSDEADTGRSKRQVRASSREAASGERTRFVAGRGDVHAHDGRDDGDGRDGRDAPISGRGEGSVGISIDVQHVAATPPGHRVRAEAEVTKSEGRRLEFTVRAFDETEEIGSGTHRRAVIDKAKFNERIKAKVKL